MNNHSLVFLLDEKTIGSPLGGPFSPGQHEFPCTLGIISLLAFVVFRILWFTEAAPLRSGSTI